MRATDVGGEVPAPGFAVALYPTDALRLAGRLFTSLFTELREHGRTGKWSEQMMSLNELNELVGQETLESFAAEIVKSASVRVP